VAAQTKIEYRKLLTTRLYHTLYYRLKFMKSKISVALISYLVNQLHLRFCSF